MLSSLLKSIFTFSSGGADVKETELEELCTISGFKHKEVQRLRKIFDDLAEMDESRSQPYLSKKKFLSLECMINHPLADRIALCFGYEGAVEKLDFRSFLCSVASFNLPGSKEKKLRIAFRIQDFDGDGYLSKGDLTEYINRITGGAVSESEVSNLVAEVLKESSSDANQETISLTDFQHVVARLDFQARLHIPI